MTPYYAVIFTNRLAPEHPGYEEMASRMAEEVRRMPGFLGFESARGADGLGITVSYWESREAIAAWKRVPEHQEAQAGGRAQWYAHYRIRSAEVLEEREFVRR